jgi:hypothetical protein
MKNNILTSYISKLFIIFLIVSGIIYIILNSVIEINSKPVLVLNTKKLDFNNTKKDISIKKLKTRSMKKLNLVLEDMDKLNNFFKKRYDDIKANNIDGKYYNKKITLGADINFNEDYARYKDMIKNYKILLEMMNNADKVIEVSVENMLSKEYENIIYSKEFLLAELDKLKILLSEKNLKMIKNSNEYYAKQIMIKSLANYIDYEPKLAKDAYNKAKKAFPALEIITALNKQYLDLSIDNTENLKYAHVLLSSMKQNENGMNKTADILIGANKAKKLRKLGYNLYLNVKYKTSVRIYTIVEYISKVDLLKKMSKIEGIVKNPIIGNVSKKIPKEYILRETRKKIYVADSSIRNNAKVFANKLKRYNFNNVLPRGKWAQKFSVYAIYYDGKSYDKKDLKKILNAVRDITEYYSINTYAYQQSKGTKIKKMFVKDETLKYLIILEYNNHIKP